MNPPAHGCSIGFANDQFEPGVHVCHIYGDDQEQQNALLKFLLTGVRGGERSSCFSEHCDEQAIAQELSRNGISYAEVSRAGAVILGGVREVYFESGDFDPDRMLGRLRGLYRESLEQGYPAARVIGDMLPEVLDIAGRTRLLEYESRVTLLQRECPITAVCQYDGRAFSGADILEILKVHPLTVVQGAVIRNPFYIPPETYLALQRDASR
ncbi:MEDS domain-containing protein [Thiorhodococcus minor]|uniref:MEDS domain-containing protein n=1 Tax=Thiorhodococcus minor TaxID=57489 RepID=A0A6M0JW69_9GAMM|nr:MEDS domain-containing protein [Thiorhodococcus minor]NEV60567.1 hypothetical protein [Thiorhodococcus minor]